MTERERKWKQRIGALNDHFYECLGAKLLALKTMWTLLPDLEPYELGLHAMHAYYAENWTASGRGRRGKPKRTLLSN